MKPMGRKKIQLPDAKHKPKADGKHLTGWWENIVSLSKKRGRQEAKKHITKELEITNGQWCI